MILRIVLAVIAASSSAFASRVPKCDALINSSTHPIVGTSSELSMTKNFLDQLRLSIKLRGDHIFAGFMKRLGTSKSRSEKLSYTSEILLNTPFPSEPLTQRKNPVYASLRLEVENVQPDQDLEAQYKLTGKAQIEVYRNVAGRKANSYYEEIEDIPLRFVGYKYSTNKRGFPTERRRQYQAEIIIDGKRSTLFVDISESNIIQEGLGGTTIPIWQFTGQWNQISIK